MAYFLKQILKNFLKSNFLEIRLNNRHSQKGWRFFWAAFSALRSRFFCLRFAAAKKSFTQVGLH